LCAATFTLAAGCADILGIDNEYVTQQSEVATGGKHSTGGASARGGSENGGTPAAGGEAAGSGGEAASGGDDAGSEPADAGCAAGDCGGGKKCCTGGNGKASCVLPAPLFGCSLDTCDRCPMPPLEGVAICQNNACNVACNPGFELVGAACEPIQSGTGGITGAGGKAGTGGGTSTGGASCDNTKCGGCGPAGPFGCCRNDHTCGCTWAPGAVCY
jgi:hypothetical protein